MRSENRQLQARLKSVVSLDKMKEALKGFNEMFCDPITNANCIKDENVNCTLDGPDNFKCTSVSGSGCNNAQKREKQSAERGNNGGVVILW